jgi:hypothetical protein
MSNIYKSTNSGGGVVDSVTGTNGVTASPTTGNVVVSGVPATTTTLGVASFNGTQFSVTAGAVSLLSSAYVASITAGANINLTGTANNPIINVDNQLLQPSGTAGAPSYSFSADPTTGYYYIASGPELALSVAGANVMTIGSFNAIINPGTIFNNQVWIQGGIQVNYTNPSSYPYSAVSGTDYYISVNTASTANTINLPNAPKTNEIFVVKDRSGNASTNNITVTTPGGAVLFDGSTSFVIDSNYGSIQVIFNGTNYEVY